MKKRIISLFLAIFMIVGIIPLSAITAFASSFAYVEYIDETGVLQSKFMNNVGIITADTRVIGDGWYIVNKDVTLPEDANLTVNGNAKIILCDGCTLQITAYEISAPGIALSSGNTLNVFGQQIGSGTIETHGGNRSAGIGGAYGGTCGTVNIYGGKVYAYGGSQGQGIGGGFNGGAGTVNVYGGYLYAQGGSTYRSINGTLTVFADQTKNKIMYVRENGNNISGSPFKSKKENITITPETALEVETVGVDSKYIDRYWDEENNCVVSEEKAIPSGAVSVTSDTTTLSDGWYVVDKNITLPNGKHLTVTGNAKLILCDGCTLKIPSPEYQCSGIDLGDGNSDTYSLTVYGQKKGSGKIEAYSGNQGAGIGGKENGAGGKLNVCGGNIEAHGINAAGIGGGDLGSGGTVNVYGGTIKAYGGGNGAGIGGAYYGGSGGTLNIYDGIIEAYGGGNAAGIGGAYHCNGGTVNIYGGIIKAYGNGEGSGIGSGRSEAGGTVNVHGGKIEAYGGDNGAGIGGGFYGSKGALNIYDNCTIYAEGGDGDKGVNSAITLYPDGAESGAPEIHITGDGTEIAGSPFTEKTEISNPLNAKTVIIGSPETRWTSTTTLPTSDGYYVLENDVTLSIGWNAPANAEITLDLNGHTIKRDLSAATENGYVICVSGKLTLLDSSENATGLVTGGKNTGNGGGILACADSVVTLSGITVSGNYANVGGGLIISEKATVKLNNCKIINNTANGAAGIYNSGTLTVTGGCLNNNHATNNSGGFYADDGSAKFKDCEIKNNRSDNYGGAFFIDYSAAVALDGCTVSGNTAKNGGGAFEMERDNCVLALENSSITGNSIDNENNGIKKGGGIHFYKGSVTFKGNVTVKYNTCAGAINNICMRGNTVTFDASELSGDSVIYVNDGVLSDISGITSANINALVMENGNHIVLNNGNLTNHTPDYTGDYVDNGDGTHSRKCIECEIISAETEAHTWEVNDFRTHKCTLCGVVCNHEDKNEDHECDACKYQICDHNNTVISYYWSENHSICTATKHCNDCNNDIETETATKIKLIEDTHGANCQTMGKGHYEATFATLGSAKTEINGTDTKYGDHHYIDFVCEYCLDEDWWGAYEKAKEDIDRAAGENPTAIVEMLAEYAEDLIYSTNYVAEVFEIRDEYIAAIKKLTAEEPHEHTFSDVWSHNETHHWHESTCEHGGLTSDFGAHTFGNGVADGNKTVYTCSECGYQKIVYNTAGDNEGEVIGGVSYTGISLTLGSDISINFYMDLTEDALTNGKMVFIVGNRTVEAEVQHNSNGYYFTCPLTALEMAETVKATFTYNSIDYIQEYSVEEYADQIVINADKYGDEAVALAKKIANYGHYAQTYLESIHKSVTIGDDGYAAMGKYGEVDIDVAKAAEALASYKVTVTGTSENISLYGSTVYFDSATALNYYITAKDGVAPTATAVNTVTGKSKDVEIKLYKNNIYIVSVKDITATELADDITVMVNSELTLNGSVFAYCKAVMNKDGQTEAAKNAMAAFYEYYEAAVEYAKTQG